MLLHLKHLLLEATRKCNMACPHCMRGDAEDLSMDYAVLDRIFEDTRPIDHLVPVSYTHLTGTSIMSDLMRCFHFDWILLLSKKRYFISVRLGRLYYVFRDSESF